jgi:hypothetical protein
MIYNIYIAEDCHQCQEVIDGINELDLEINFINVDLEDKKPPIDVFAFPALFKGDVLLRYGSDIIEYLKKLNAE